MIAIVLLAAAGTCRADDPLESLNTVEETLSQLAQYRAAHGSASTDTSRRPEEPVTSVAPSTESAAPANAAPPAPADPSCCGNEPR